jgi:hypothetical protein
MNKKIERLFFVLTLLFSLIFAYKFNLLINYNLLQSYPYISNDGFDWYTEGAYLAKIITQQQFSNAPLPVLRPPLFVLICTIDVLLGERGIFISLIYGLSILLSFLYLVRLYNLIALKADIIKSKFILYIIFIGITLSPLNFIRTYLLSDGITLCLSIISVYFLFKNQIFYNKKDMWIAVFFAILASITQTYGALPFIICTSIFIIYNLNNFKECRSLVLSLITVVSLHLILILLWRNFLPHNSTPDNFNLLKIELSMFNFYVRTWSFYFLPFLLFIFWHGLSKFFAVLRLKYILPLTTSVLFIAALDFFYQWPDSRFTYILWPWILILFSLYISTCDIKNKIIFCFIFSFSVLIVPSTYWSPTLTDSKISFSNTWFSQFFKSQYIDRNITFGGIDENLSEFYLSADGYLRSVLKFYSNLYKDKP